MTTWKTQSSIFRSKLVKFDVNFFYILVVNLSQWCVQMSSNLKHNTFDFIVFGPLLNKEGSFLKNSYLRRNHMLRSERFCNSTNCFQKKQKKYHYKNNTYPLLRSESEIVFDFEKCSLIGWTVTRYSFSTTNHDRTVWVHATRKWTIPRKRLTKTGGMFSTVENLHCFVHDRGRQLAWQHGRVRGAVDHSAMLPLSLNAISI